MILVTYGSRTEMAAARVLRSINLPAVVYQIDMDLPSGFISDETSLRTEGDYLLPEDVDAIETFAGRFREEWYVVEGQDLTEWNGISLADGMSGLNVLDQLIPIIKNSLIARRLLESTRPDRIYLGKAPGFATTIWKAEAARIGIACELLVEDPPIEVESDWSPHPPAEIKPGLAFQVKMRLYRAKREALKLLEKARFGIHQLLPILSRRPLIFLLVRDRRELALIGLRPALEESSRVRLAHFGSPRAKLIARTVNPDTVAKAREFFELQWQKLVNAAPMVPHFRYENIPLWRWTESWARDLFLDTLPQCAEAAIVAKSVLHTYRPDLVVGQEGRGEQRALWASVARNMNIPVAAFQREYRVPGGSVSWPGVPCDWFFAIGPSSEEYFEKRGIPRGRMITVGDPRQHWKKGMPTPDPAAVRLQIGFDERPVVLYTDGNLHAFPASDSPLFLRRLLTLIRQTARDLPDVQFIVKFHPSTHHIEGDENIQRRINFLREEWPDNLIVAPRRSDIMTFLSVADVVVSSRSSTTGIEAMALNIPVIYVHPPELGDYYPYFDPPMRAAVRVERPSELLPMLCDILDHNERWRQELAPGQDAFLRYLYARPQDASAILERLAADPDNSAFMKSEDVSLNLTMEVENA